MIGKVLLIAVLCVSYVLAEAPINRYRIRPQRLRQIPSRQFLARQEAPYPAANNQPATLYGPPTTSEPASSYGPPAASYGPPVAEPADPEPTSNEAIDNPDSEVLPGAQPSRLSSQKLTLPSKNNAQKFSQRLELQQQVHLPSPQVQQVPQVQPVRLAPQFQLAPIQQEGSYFIQLPNGVIQRVNYLTQPSLVDNTLAARLQFRPVATAQASYNEPQVLVNTLVNSYTSADE